MYGQPGQMVGRFTLRDDRMLFLLVFAAGSASLPDGLTRQKAMLRATFTVTAAGNAKNSRRTGRDGRDLFRQG